MLSFWILALSSSIIIIVIIIIIISIDENAVQQLKEFDGKNWNSTTQAGLDSEFEDEKKKLEELMAEFVPLTKLVDGR